MIVSVLGTVIVSGGLVFSAVGGRTHRFVIVWVGPIVTGTELSQHIATKVLEWLLRTSCS